MAANAYFGVVLKKSFEGQFRAQDIHAGQNFEMKAAVYQEASR
jgi:hypothetical protein